ncbi:MAG: hypothetical protein JNL38_00040 [Myxococcales bacterium]|nr:hypothetical protein [Myxococcales bacterium]
MKTRALLALFAFALAASAAASLAACSDDDRPPPATGASGGNPPTSSSSSGGAGDGGGGGEGGSAAGLCADAGVLGGDGGAAEVPVSYLYLNGPPAPLGGAVKPGRYFLVELYEIRSPDAGVDTEGDGGRSPPPPAGAARKQLDVVDTSHYVLLEAEGAPGALGAAKVSGGFYRVVDKNLVLSEACPGNAVATLPFSAVGPQIAIQRGARREVYQVQ